jgi:hypothetical protein
MSDKDTDENLKAIFKNSESNYDDFSFEDHTQIF